MKTARAKKIGVAVVLAIAASMAGCSYLNPFNWWADSGPKIPDLPEIKPTANLRMLWQVGVGGSETATLAPAVAAGSLYAAGGEGSVLKIDPKDGRTLWRINAGTRLSGAVGADAGTVVVGSPDGEVIALEPATGIVRWRTRVSSEILAPAVVAADLVLVRSADSRVFALDAKDGRRRWVYQRSAANLSVRSPAGLTLGQGNAYGGFSGGKLVAIALSNGGVRWEATVSLPRGTNELDRMTDVIGFPWVGDREVCAAAYQGRLACFEAANGNTLWGRDVSSVSGIGVDAGYIFVTDDTGAIHALDRSSGTSVWRQDRLQRRALTTPLPMGRTVAVADIQGYVHLLARDNGAFEARAPTDGSPINAPLIWVDDRLIAQTRNGNVFAFQVQ